MDTQRVSGGSPRQKGGNGGHSESASLGDRTDRPLNPATLSNPMVVYRPSLTPNELLVLELVALGLTSREIASLHRVSRQSVTFHIANLFDKLGAQVRAELVARAYTQAVLAVARWPPERSTGANEALSSSRIP